MMEVFFYFTHKTGLDQKFDSPQKQARRKRGQKAPCSVELNEDILKIQITTAPLLKVFWCWGPQGGQRRCHGVFFAALRSVQCWRSEEPGRGDWMRGEVWALHLGHD